MSISFSISLFSENERQFGFVLIIDRRSDRWMAVKSIISYIEVNRNLIDIQCKTCSYSSMDFFFYKGSIILRRYRYE
jgi:hypothetical protein